MGLSGKGVGSDYGGKHIGSLLGTAMSRGKRCSSGGRVYKSDEGTGRSEQANALGEKETRLCLMNFVCTRSWPRCAIISKDFKRGLEGVAGVENQRQKRVLAEGRGIGDGAGCPAGGLHGELLSGTGEQRKDNRRKLQAANFYLEQCMDLSLPVGRFRVKAVGQGRDRS